MTELTWISAVEPAAADVEELRARLAAYNAEHSGIAASVDLAVFVRDEAGDLGGGITGNVWGAVLEVNFLWVRADLRGAGLGRRILARLEQEAITRGARRAFLNTYSFQAPEFYQRQGYGVTQTIEGYPGWVSKIFLRKPLG